MRLDRRTFLQATAALAGSAFLGGGAEAEEEGNRPIASRPIRGRAEFQRRLVGPILSMPTPFTASFELDTTAVRTMVDRASRAGVGVFALTSGDGQYQWLRYEEIKTLTRAVIDAVAGRGVTIAAAASWWTDQVADYARYAESVGADSVQILLPEGADEAAIVKHFEAVSRATTLPLVMHGNYSVSLLEKLVKIDAVAALKEDVTLDYYIDRERKFRDRLAIFGGGTEYRFLVGHPYGSPAYYSAYTAFAPHTAMRFWRAIQKGEMETAYDWARKYDHPFLDRWSHAFWRASLEYFGVAKRYLRPPVSSFTDEQMREVKAFYDGLGLRPGEDA